MDFNEFLKITNAKRRDFIYSLTNNMIMNIERLSKIATFHFKNIRTNCDFMKIHHYLVVEGNYEFYAYFKCKRRITIKKVVLTPTGELVDIITF